MTWVYRRIELEEAAVPFIDPEILGDGDSRLVLIE
jgi:hypothetical protein